MLANQINAIMGVASIVAALTAGLAASAPAPGSSTGWHLRRGVLSLFAAAVATAGILFVWNVLNFPPFENRGVSFETGIGDSGCIVQLSGHAQVPENEDALILLVAPNQDIWLKSPSTGAAIAQGEFDDSWSIPDVTISDRYYAAEYEFHGIILPIADSLAFQRAAAQQQPLPPSQYPKNVISTTRERVNLVSKDRCEPDAAG